MQCKGHRVGNGVIDMDKLHIKAAQLHRIARLGNIEARFPEQPVLTELPSIKPTVRRVAIHRKIHSLEQIRQSTDVILVAVGNDDTANPIGVALHKREIRQHQIDAKHIPIRNAIPQSTITISSPHS